MVLRKPITACLLALAVLIAVPLARADAFADYSVSGYGIHADLTSISQGSFDYQLQLTITNNAGNYGWVQGYSIQLFNSNITGFGFGSPSLNTNGTSNWTTLALTDNSQFNNSASGTNSCQTTGNGFGSVCEYFSGGSVGLAQGQFLTFNVLINSGGASVMSSSGWHLISDATKNSDGTGGNTGYAISATPNGVPEPASLSLLGAGLLGLGMKMRRRSKRA